MTCQIGVVLCGPAFPKWPDKSTGDATFSGLDNSENRKTPCECYQEILDSCTADILVMLHADVTIHDPEWLNRIMMLFENPECVAVGPGGAIGLGTPDLYRKPFRIQNMIRIGYASNQDDWQVHGGHFTGNRRVAVLEQFCMAVRVEWLRNRGGWPVGHCNHHMLDAFIACEAARDDKEVWQCGFSVLHSGGAASTSPIYREAKWLHGGSLVTDHIAPHRWIFSRYPDVLPIVISQ